MGLNGHTRQGWRNIYRHDFGTNLVFSLEGYGLHSISFCFPLRTASTDVGDHKLAERIASVEVLDCIAAEDAVRAHCQHL